MFRQFCSIFILMAAIPGLSSAFTQEQPQTFQEPELVVPDGTILPIILTAFMNSRSTQVGDMFYAETAYPVWIQQRMVIPRGSLVKGSVTHVVRPGRIRGRGQLAIRFESVLLPNGVSRPLVAGFRSIHGPGAERIDRTKETVEMDSSKGEDAREVAGSTGQGAIIGAIAGGGKGAGIGAGAGAAVGLVTTLFSRGRELILEPGTQFDLELKQPLRFAYSEVDFNAQEMNGPPRTYRRPRTDRDAYPAGRRGPIPWIFPW